MLKRDKIKNDEYICHDCRRNCSPYIQVYRYIKDQLLDHMEYMKHQGKLVESLSGLKGYRLPGGGKQGIIFYDEVGMFRVYNSDKDGKYPKELFRYDQVAKYGLYKIETEPAEAGKPKEFKEGCVKITLLGDQPNPVQVPNGRRAWHTEHNRPVILSELKTKAAERNIPIPDRLYECLKEAKANSASKYVVANRDGEPLSYTQFKRLWQYIVTRTAKERVYYRYENGQRVQHTVHPVLGEKAAHNGKVVYSLDFDVTPHQLRHTYITNLLYAGVDPKTVQYLAGHENSKTTMDIYAKVKHNKPEELIGVVNRALM